MKLKDVYRKVNQMRPNAFLPETITDWVNEAEGLVQTEVLLYAIEECKPYVWETDQETELLAHYPHDKIYTAYVLALMELDNAEYDKYNNLIAVFNDYFSEFARWYSQRYRPADIHAEPWKGFYFTAYGIALKHGFVGTEEEWLASLKGDKGDAFTYEDFTPEQIQDLKDGLVQGAIDEANAAKTAAEKARDEAVTAESGAVTAKTGAETAKTAAETAKTGAETAQTGAETAQTAAETAQNGAADARDEAVTAAGTAEDARNDAQLAARNAGLAQNSAQEAALNAGNAQTAAEAAASSAENAKAGAEAAKTGAEAALEGFSEKINDSAPAPDKVYSSQKTQEELDKKLNSTDKGTAGGVASLGADGKVPAGQLPEMGGGVQIDDTAPSATKVYSSKKVNDTYKKKIEVATFKYGDVMVCSRTAEEMITGMDQGIEYVLDSGMDVAKRIAYVDKAQNKVVFYSVEPLISDGVTSSLDGKKVTVGPGNAVTVERMQSWEVTYADKLAWGAKPDIDDAAAAADKVYSSQKTEAAIKAAVDALGTVFDYKGSKPSKTDLPAAGNQAGDVWFVVDESVGYVWLKEGRWEPFGPTIDLTGYVQKTTKVNGKALDKDIDLTAADIKARPETWEPDLSGYVKPTNSPFKGAVLTGVDNEYAYWRYPLKVRYNIITPKAGGGWSPSMTYSAVKGAVEDGETVVAVVNGYTCALRTPLEELEKNATAEWYFNFAFANGEMLYAYVWESSASTVQLATSGEAAYAIAKKARTYAVPAPAADGTDGQLLASDGAGNTKWIEPDFVSTTETEAQALQGNFSAKYVEGTWLKTTAATVNNGLSHIAMIDGQGWIYKMDKSQLVKDVIAAIPAAEGVSV